MGDEWEEFAASNIPRPASVQVGPYAFFLSILSFAWKSRHYLCFTSLKNEINKNRNFKNLFVYLDNDKQAKKNNNDKTKTDKWHIRLQFSE